MKKNLNRLLLLPVSAIAINQAQAMDEQNGFNEQYQQFETKEIENYAGNTQDQFNDYNNTSMTNNNNDYNNEYMTSIEQMDTFNNNTNNINSGSSDMNFVRLRDQIFDYIKGNSMLTYAAAIHRGNINNFMTDRQRINLNELTQMVITQYNGNIDQATPDINRAVLEGIFKYMTVGEVLENGGLHDTSSIIQNVLVIAAADKKAIVPSLLRTNLNSFGTLLHTELPENKNIDDSNASKLAYALSFLTATYLSLQGQEGFVEPPAESLTKVKGVLEKHNISLEIEGIALSLDPNNENNNKEKKDALLNELKEVLCDTCYTSIKKDLFEALYTEEELKSMEEGLSESDSPVTEEVLNNAIEFYKAIAKTGNPLKFKQSLDTLEKIFKNNHNNLKTEFIKDMQKSTQSQNIKNAINDDNNIKDEDNNLNLEPSKENMDKSINNIKVGRKEQKNETNVQNKNNLNSSKRYNNPSSSVQNPLSNEVMNQSSSILQTIDQNMYSLVTLLEQRNGLNNYQNRITLSQLQRDISYLSSGIQRISAQRNIPNNVLQAAQNMAYTRMVSAHKKLSGLQNNVSQFEREVSSIANNLQMNNVNYVLLRKGKSQNELTPIKQQLSELLKQREITLQQINRIPLSGLGQSQYSNLVSRLKSIDVAISEATKTGNGIIAREEQNKNQIGSFGGMSNNFKYNSSYGSSGTTYGSNRAMNFDIMK